MGITVGDSFIMAGAIIVVLAVLIGLPIWMSRRPYAKNPKPPGTETGVSGGIHEGDPRSMSPHRDEVVEPPSGDAPLTSRHRGGQSG